MGLLALVVDCSYTVSFFHARNTFQGFSCPFLFKESKKSTNTYLPTQEVLTINMTKQYSSLLALFISPVAQASCPGLPDSLAFVPSANTQTLYLLQIYHYCSVFPLQLPAVPSPIDFLLDLGLWFGVPLTPG